MSQNDHADSITGSVHGSEQQQPPGLLIGNQYLRSFSLDVPNTPETFANVPLQPHLHLEIDVNARQLEENQPNFEVTLVIRAQGLRDAPTTEAPQPDRLYRAELAYAGFIALQNATSATLEPLLLVEAPRMLFPGARAVLANNIREAGFPVAVMQPVDFAALWVARRAKA